jgi:hypothetical protein
MFIVETQTGGRKDGAGQLQGGGHDAPDTIVPEGKENPGQIYLPGESGDENPLFYLLCRRLPVCVRDQGRFHPFGERACESHPRSRDDLVGQAETCRILPPGMQQPGGQRDEPRGEVIGYTASRLWSTRPDRTGQLFLAPKGMEMSECRQDERRFFHGCDYGTKIIQACAKASGCGL